ncbi:MAG: thioredoxin family protein [Bacteroidota bacterium]
MATTPSNMLPLGTIAPDFALPDTVSGNTQTLSELQGDKGTVIMFICNHCPYVLHVLSGILSLSEDYQSKGISFVAISSNDVVKYPADAPDKMKELATERGFNFPYLFDESQEVARAYQAACTPDFMVFDADLTCVYRGRMDGSRPGSNVPVSGEDIRNALEAILANQQVAGEQIPSIGCNIKWK